MRGKPKKAPREKDLTERYFSGHYDEDRAESIERFRDRNKGAQHRKMLRTAELRAQEDSDIDVESLPIGQVIQVHSLFSEVEHAGQVYLCVVRRTLTRISKSFVIVGDRVRFRDVTKQEGERPADQPPEGVIEQILPRATVLTRSESFKGHNQHPIVANAQQMLIVASIRQPTVKWGLVDRMIIAAQGGGLLPIVCLNKMDLAPSDATEAVDVLAHYATLGVSVIETSVTLSKGLETLRALLDGKTTVLAGHSGVGKSSLITAIAPSIDIRVGEVSAYTDKGRHTTTSARRYKLDEQTELIDTPGVKMFGLWGVTADNLDTFFPDVHAGDAPAWRAASYQRIADSIS